MSRPLPGQARPDGPVDIHTSGQNRGTGNLQYSLGFQRQEQGLPRLPRSFKEDLSLREERNGSRTSPLYAVYTWPLSLREIGASGAGVHSKQQGPAASRRRSP